MEPGHGWCWQQAPEEAIATVLQELPGLCPLGSVPLAPSAPDSLSWLLLLLWLLLTPVPSFYHLSSFSRGIARSWEWLNLVFYSQDPTVCKLRELALVGVFSSFLFVFPLLLFAPSRLQCV